MFWCARIGRPAMLDEMLVRPTCYALTLAFVSLACGACRGGKLGRRPGKGATSGAGGGAAETVVLGGSIRLVRESLGFVLIQSSSAPPPKGAELFVHRGGSGEPVARLRVSPEVKTGFVVADILSGMPKVGDLVMWSMPGAVENPVPGTVPDLPVQPPTFDDIPPLGPVPDPEPGGPPAALPANPEDELEREIRAGAGLPPPAGG